MLLFYVAITFFSIAIVNSAATSAVKENTATAMKNSIASLLSSRPARDFPYDSKAKSGSISYQPRDAEDYSDINARAAVYDPGDELMKALNAELNSNGQELGVLPEEPDYADTVFNELEIANKYDMLRKLIEDINEEQEMISKSAMLMKLVADPAIEILPVVYVEDVAVDDMSYNDLTLPTQISKRSRYYRRYPWKRHNRNRSNYEPELRYACTPSKEDVFKLLVNLHENRKGNHGKTVSFCNRKRPAKAIFTNIRFLG